MKGVSVVVCCYNSASRLPETLKHLALQHIDNSIKWEVIIVDNACKDSSVEVAKHEWLKYPDCEASFKIVSQPKPGLSYARETGISESKYDLLLFCDDDNWLAPDFIRRGFEIFSKNDKIGILGTFGIPSFEVTPPIWFLQLNINQATGKQSEKSGNITEKEGVVYGAGMFMHKSVFTEMSKTGFKSLLTDRKGDSLSSGGDGEYCYFARLLGFEIHYTDELKFHHFIPKERIAWKYNIRIYNSYGYSYAFLIIYIFLYETKSNNWFTWKSYLVRYLLNLLSIQFKSPKRLYFFWFNKTEGEEYILNYSFRIGLIKGIWCNIISSSFFKVKSQINNEINPKSIEIVNENRYR
jgi:glycosyltransferase involved in cell wall biosynthesis